MKKFIENFKRYYRAYLIYGTVFAVIGVGIFLLFFFLGDKSLSGATNGIGWSALALFFLGCLILLSNYGAYDFLSYGFQQMFTSLFSIQTSIMTMLNTVMRRTKKDHLDHVFIWRPTL